MPERIKHLIMKFFCERKGDKSQRDVANYIYNEIIKDFAKYQGTKAKNFLNITVLVGERFGVIFNPHKKECEFKINLKNKDLNHIIIGCKNLLEYYEKEDYKSCLIIRKSAFIHELVHYLDEKRNKAFADKEPTNMSDYVNDESEFNAYYQGVASRYDDILNKIIKLKSSDIERKKTLFQKYFGKNNEDFRARFIIKMGYRYPHIIKYTNEKYVWKWNKRIYQLYNELKEKFEKEI